MSVPSVRKGAVDAFDESLESIERSGRQGRHYKQESAIVLMM
jgi:hypothetical protein